MNFKINLNKIWDIKDEESQVFRSFNEKEQVGGKYFEKLFKSPWRMNPIQEILEVTSKFLVVFYEYMNKVSSEEFWEVEISVSLLSMQNGNISHMDGFIVEFFKCFYDTIRDDLLLMVRESQRNIKMLGSFNSTFLSLIPKKHEGDTFGDFRSISYCNMIWKIITKVIARKLNPILSDIIGEEQLVFLQNRKIHDVIVSSPRGFEFSQEEEIEGVYIENGFFKGLW
jgi:hypothetical protein